MGRERPVWMTVGLLLLLLESGTAHAALSVTNFVYGTEDAAISGHTTEGFEDVTMLSGLTIRFSGGIDVAQRTYSGTLPRVFEPAAGAGIDPPWMNNTWDGIYALTNGGHGPGTSGSGSPGDGNFWDFSFAEQTEFIFSSPLQSFGIGLSNFQSLDWPGPPLTDHELIINGTSWGLVDDLPGWQGGVDVRNGYILITASGGDQIFSIGIKNVSTASPDGLIFDKLAILPDPVPIELSKFTVD